MKAYHYYWFQLAADLVKYWIFNCSRLCAMTTAGSVII
uniref:Uncharacterized protein n=1 Tax=Klebsiella pneumoniae TaxID=573 RepID=A0A8B0SUM0_KLEPN|nr:hypothetical protein [Klebsiella pneumoniae]